MAVAYLKNQHAVVLGVFDEQPPASEGHHGHHERGELSEHFQKLFAAIIDHSNTRVTYAPRDKPDYRDRLGSEILNRSLTASLNFCLHPMYRSVVWTEA
jgi:hypothetical protein